MGSNENKMKKNMCSQSGSPSALADGLMQQHKIIKPF